MTSKKSSGILCKGNRLEAYRFSDEYQEIQYRYDKFEELDYAINNFAYVWYNQIRNHYRNGYLTPSKKRFGLK